MLRLFCTKCNQFVSATECAEPRDDAAGTCPGCGALLPAHRYIAPGTEINGFRVEHEIGRGGMGIVYLARQLDLDRDVALKILSDEMASDSTLVRSFFREARAAAALNHPNIVLAYDAGTDKKRCLHYFVMELIEGENLEIYTAKHGALPTALALKCATQIADALAYAWNTKRLAHRDIKPENIILTQNNDFKLADLGLARAYDGKTQDNSDDGMATPAYASPEVIRRELDKIGFRSDLYSFGATLYQLFTGTPPFTGSDPMEVCGKQLNEQPKPLIGVNPELPSELSILVDKLMEKAPEKRPESWDFVLERLNRITGNFLSASADDAKLKDVSAQEPHLVSFIPLPEKKQIKRKLLSYAAGTAILLLTAGILLGILLQKQTDHYPEQSGNGADTAKSLPLTPEETPADMSLAPAESEPSAAAIRKSGWQDVEAEMPAATYDRWCYLKNYTPVYPEETAPILAALEQHAKKPWQEQAVPRMKSLRERFFTDNLTEDELRKLSQEYSDLVKQVSAYPLWADEIFSKDEQNTLKLHTETLTAKLEQMELAKKTAERNAEIAMQEAETRRLITLKLTDAVMLEEPEDGAEKAAVQAALAKYNAWLNDPRMAEYEQNDAELAEKAKVIRRQRQSLRNRLSRINQQQKAEKEKETALKEFYAAVRKNDLQEAEKQYSFLLKNTTLPDTGKQSLANILLVLKEGSLSMQELFKLLDSDTAAGSIPFPVTFKRSTIKNITDQNLVLLYKAGSGLRLTRSVPWDKLEKDSKRMLEELLTKSDLIQPEINAVFCRAAVFCALRQGIGIEELEKIIRARMKRSPEKDNILRAVSDYCNALSADAPVSQ